MNKKRRPADYAKVTLKGLCMGAADIVPGVSGGTIAFITGIYDELLDSLKSIGPGALVILKREGFKAAWQHVNANFLIALFAGVLISIKTFAIVITYLLERHPLLLWGFFCGLIFASAVVLFRQEKKWPISSLFPFAVGVVTVLIIAIAPLPQIQATKLTMFLGGFVAISAMILPGVSGSFILLLVGLYPAALDAVNNHDFPILISFLLGCVAGLMVFSRFLSWLLKAYREHTLAVLMGFLVGSLYVTWPWKVPLKTILDRHGEQVVLSYQNVLPHTFEATNGNEAQFLFVGICVLLGGFLVLFSEVFATKRDENS